MKTENYNRIVEMSCPVCADDLFMSGEEENGLIVCNSCSTQFTKTDLLEANMGNIHAHKKELVDKAINDAVNQFEKNIKNVFKNSKIFKVR